MATAVNFSNLQTITSVGSADQILIRLNNALSGTAGFARVTKNSLLSSVDMTALSGNWQSTYTTVQAYSASWALDSTIDTPVRNLTGGWQTTYSTVSSLSSDWQTTYSTVSSLSSDWGLSLFKQVSSIASPNNLAYTFGFSALPTGSPSVDFSILPSGSGAILATIPDNTAAGGNKRGADAVDFQRDRSSSDQVASGNYTVVVGGSANKASGDFSLVVGGLSSYATTFGSLVVGGSANNADGTGPFQVIVGGSNNTTSGGAGYGFIGGGQSNTCSASWNAVAGGRSNSVANTYSFIGAGRSNSTAGGGQYNTIVCGFSGKASGWASFVGAGSSNNVTGDYAGIIAGVGNLASGGQSFIACGSGNSTNNQFNTFILGSNIVAPSANYTYVNNISSNGVINGNVISTLSGCDFIAKFNVVNTNTYLLTLSDASKTLLDVAASNTTLQLPKNATTSFPIGTQIALIQGNKTSSNYTIISASGDVTVNSFGNSLSTGGNYAAATLIKSDTNTWYLIGNLQ